jgi:hypothetical protein
MALNLQHVMRKLNQTYRNERKVATGISQMMLNCLMLGPETDEILKIFSNFSSHRS